MGGAWVCSIVVVAANHWDIATGFSQQALLNNRFSLIMGGDTQVPIGRLFTSLTYLITLVA